MIDLPSDRIGTLAVFLIDIPDIAEMPGTHDGYATFFEMMPASRGHVRRVRCGICDAPNPQRVEGGERAAKGRYEPRFADRFHVSGKCRLSSFAERVTCRGMRQYDHAGRDHGQ